MKPKSSYRTDSKLTDSLLMEKMTFQFTCFATIFQRYISEMPVEIE